MQKFDICIVGGGASGSVLAIMLAKKGKKVCVVDRFLEPAKKLLVTGNGKCNITNKNLSSEFYNQNIDDFLKDFGFEQTQSFFESIGIDIYADKEGRCYPISNSAKSVQIAIKNQFEKLDISFFGGVEIDDIKRENEKFITKIDDEEIISNRLVLTCGINNFSKNICQKFGIKVRNEVPSLVALKTKQSTKRLDGLRANDVLVKAICKGFEREEVGEILFKDHGLSGIVIFDLSSLFAKNSCFEGKISINLLKNWSKTQIFEKLTAKVDIFQTVDLMMQSMFSKELANEILHRANIDLNMQTKNLSKNNFENIVEIITNFEFDIVGHYDNNQVLSGGVKLDELTKNLESKKVPNLYFSGELCDVDGICGGYNLQWAWASVFAVAKDIQ